MCELEVNGVKKKFNSLNELGAFTLLNQVMGLALQYAAKGKDIPKDLLEKIGRHSGTLLGDEKTDPCTNCADGLLDEITRKDLRIMKAIEILKNNRALDVFKVLRALEVLEGK